jgi:hypothetical protein
MKTCALYAHISNVTREIGTYRRAKCFEQNLYRNMKHIIRVMSNTFFRKS